MSTDQPPRPAGQSPVTVADGPLIGVCWQPGQRVPTPILGGHDRPRVDGRYGIHVRYGDDMRGRCPTHYEWHTLCMHVGEPVVELERASRQREVYRARLVGVVSTGSTVEVTRPDGSTLLLGEDAFCVIASEMDTPDPRTPRWRRVVEDVHADVAAGRLRTGDELPTPTQLASMYGCAASTVHRAPRRLTADGLVVSRPGWGRFVTDKHSTSCGG